MSDSEQKDQRGPAGKGEETTKIDFQSAYSRLKEIADRVNAEDVPPDEMFALLSEGKGLEQALTAYLAEQKSLIEEMESGEGVKPFAIVSPSELGAE